MSGKKNKTAPVTETLKEKTTPAYLREDYLYQTIG